MKIRIERMDEDGLARARWCFELALDYGRQEMVLEEYFLEHRETRRKQTWEKDKAYSRMGLMRNYRDEQKICSSDVPVPEEVERELRDKLVEFVRTVPIIRKVER